MAIKLFFCQLTTTIKKFILEEKYYKGAIKVTSLLHPASVDWEVTPFCNHNCIHCYNCWRTDEDRVEDIKFNKSVDERWYLKIAEIIADNKPVSVIITGGEPLSVFWKIDKAIEHLIKNGIYVTMNTNLTLLDDKMALRIKELGLHIFTSIPSANPKNCDKITGVNGSFTNIKNGILKCLSYNIPLATNMVVTKININDIEETASFIKNIGMDYFCCTKAAFPANAQPSLHENILTQQEFSSVFTQLMDIGSKQKLRVDSAWAYSLCGLSDKQIAVFGFKRRCGAGRFNFAITYTGDIKACNVDTAIYGNILKDSMNHAMEKMVAWQTNAYLPEECKDCKSLYLCSGGCRLEAENTFGKKSHLDSTANTANIERTVLPPRIIEFDDDKKYHLTQKCILVEENGFYRISQKSFYEFITEECKKFFDCYENFDLRDFTKELSLTPEIARLEFSEFIDKGFFVQTR